MFTLSKRQQSTPDTCIEKFCFIALTFNFQLANLHLIQNVNLDSGLDDIKKKLSLN